MFTRLFSSATFGNLATWWNQRGRTANHGPVGPIIRLDLPASHSALSWVWVSSSMLGATWMNGQSAVFAPPPFDTYTVPEPMGNEAFYRVDLDLEWNSA